MNQKARIQEVIARFVDYRDKAKAAEEARKRALTKGEQEKLKETRTR